MTVLLVLALILLFVGTDCVLCEASAWQESHRNDALKAERSSAVGLKQVESH